MLTTDAGDYHPISSPGAFGSGELKKSINKYSNYRSEMADGHTDGHRKIYHNIPPKKCDGVYKGKGSPWPNSRRGSGG